MIHQRIALALFAVVSLALASGALGKQPDSVQTVVNQFCAGCHDADAPKAGLNLEAAAKEEIERNPKVWEKVVRRLRGRQMPPADEEERPSENSYVSTISQLEIALDRAAAEHLNPGRTD